MPRTKAARRWRSASLAVVVGALGVGAGAVVLWAAPGERPANPPGMACQFVTLVEYHPGPHWDKFAEHAPQHVAFLRTHLDAGELLHAGPFVDADGGLNVYASDDLVAVDALVNQDPLVCHKVVTYTLRRWRRCAAAGAPAGTIESSP